MEIIISKESLTFARRVRSLTGENPMLCYQCKKCTLGCPSAYAMRMKPHELMRALQLGLTEEIYWSGAIWACVSCETCNTRCPQSIHILRVIDGLRELSKAFGYYNPQPSISMMHRLLLGFVQQYGRVYELGLALFTHLGTLTPLKDIDLAASMLRHGEIRLLPSKSRERKELGQALARLRKMERSEETSRG